ncbi:MAG: hypothetical protein HYT15_03100 [Candidatus Magasanikbacteria bacterium]|nr:hypothetical protein [Candidatus Magasanikbacteria bacterium]
MKISKQTILLSLIAFIFHLVWENVQRPLFQGYGSFIQHFPVCFVATIGDVVFTFLVYAFMALVKKDWNWIARLNKTDIFILAIVGFLFAVGIEWRALLFGRWAYADAMPIIPYLKVGLAPVMQMVLLLPFSIYISASVVGRKT